MQKPQQQIDDSKSVTTRFQIILRTQCDEIMTIIGADPDLPYSELAAAVKAWGARKEANGIIHGMNNIL